MKNLFINSAAKPAKHENASGIKSSRKFDYVILPIPQSATDRGKKMDWSDCMGIRTSIDSFTKAYLMQNGVKGKCFVASNPSTLIEGVENGAIETSLVVCSQCRGLTHSIQMILMRTTKKLHKLGISVVFIKDDIEFRSDEDFTSLTKRFAKHIGCYPPEPDKGTDALIEKHTKEEVAA